MKVCLHPAKAFVTLTRMCSSAGLSDFSIADAPDGFANLFFQQSRDGFAGFRILEEKASNINLVVMPHIQGSLIAV
jgi:hypothetical protein